MRLPLRALVFWMHLTVAVVVGLVVLLLAATGLLLSFETQILAFADRDAARVVAPSPIDAFVVESPLTSVATQDATLAPSSVTIHRDADRAIALALGREGVAYVDRASGAVTGQGSTGARKTMRTITELHRYLAAAGDSRPLGKGVTGAANLAFFFILLSGLYLWVPRVLDRVRLGNVLWFRRGLTSKARDFNWHHVFGFWMWVPLVLIVVSAVPMSYTWGNDLVFRLTGSPPPPKQAAAPRPATTPSTPESSPPLATQDLTGLDRVFARASSEYPTWQSISLRLPLPAEGPVTVTVDESARRGRPDLRTTLVVDRASGQLVKKEVFAEQSTGRRVRSWMRWIHTGEVAGLPGQIVAALACAATLLLGWTGFALALRRLGAWLRRRAGEPALPSTRVSRPTPAPLREGSLSFQGKSLREEADV